MLFPGIGLSEFVLLFIGAVVAAKMFRVIVRRDKAAARSAGGGTPATGGNGDGYCTACGKAIRSTSRFCGACGVEREGAAAQPNA